VLAVLTVLAMLFPPMIAGEASAAESVAMPFPGGKSVKIVQGYNGGTHQGRSKFGLDIILAGEETSGAEVVSPVGGIVTWAQAPNAGHGCIAIAMSSGAHSVMMCHVSLNKAWGSGDAVSRGQTIGKVGAPGTVGNNNVAHIHYELHSGNRASSPVPFSEPDGLLLEGVSLPPSSTTAVISKLGPIVSSNKPGSGPAPVTAQNGTRTVPLSSSGGSDPKPVAAASLPTTVRSIPGTAGAGSAAGGARMAVVQGTDSCLKVRKQPSADAPVIGCLKDGTEVALRPLAAGADPKWRQTDQGWVSSDYLKRTGAVIVGTDACLNVRESAKASSAKLGCLPDGTSVKIVDGPVEADGFAWYRIDPAGSVEKSGWVVGKHLD